MWPCAIEVEGILAENAAKMRFTQDEDVIEAFAPHTPQQPLTDRVRAWGLDRRAEYLNAGSGCDGFKVGTVLAIVIADQISRREPEGRGLPQLLSDPLVCGRAGHAEMDDAPRAEFGDDEGKERPEEDVMSLEEIVGPDIFRMIAKEGLPGLSVGAWRPSRPQVPLHGTFRDRDAELQQLAPDALRTPQPIVGSDLLDEPNRLGWDFGFMRPRARFPLPKQAPALSMPPQHGLWFDNEQCLLPARKLACQQDEEARSAHVKCGRLTERLRTTSC